MSNFNQLSARFAFVVNFELLAEGGFSMETRDEIVDILRDEGAVFRDTPWGPVAVDFGDWQAEYRAFRQGAGLFRPPSVTQVEITGSQRAEFLNRLCTNRLDRIQPGEGCETFLADANGRILHHVFVYAGPESLVLHTAAGLGKSLCSHLDYYLIREDVQFHDRSSQWGELILAGPQSADIVAASRRPRTCQVETDTDGQCQRPMERPPADGPPPARVRVPELSTLRVKRPTWARSGERCGNWAQRPAACGPWKRSASRRGFPSSASISRRKPCPRRSGGTRRPSHSPRAAIWDRKLSPASTAAARSTRFSREFASARAASRRRPTFQLPAAN